MDEVMEQDEIGTVDQAQKEKFENFRRVVMDTPINLTKTQREEAATAKQAHHRLNRMEGKE